MKTLTHAEAAEFIRSTNGKILAVEFVKRTTGETRLMNCRTGVHSHLSGGVPAYDAASKGLITIFDMHKNGYRSIPVEGITRIKVNGEWVAVEN